MQITNMSEFHKHIKRVIISEEELKAAITRTGEILSM